MPRLTPAQVRMREKATCYGAWCYCTAGRVGAALAAVGLYCMVGKIGWPVIIPIDQFLTTSPNKGSQWNTLATLAIICLVCIGVFKAEVYVFKQFFSANKRFRIFFRFQYIDEEHED